MFRVGELELAHRGSSCQGILQFLEHIEFKLRFGVSGSSPPPHLADSALHAFEVGEGKFRVYDIYVGLRRDLAGYMGYGIVDETAHHMNDRLGFAYVCEELIAEPFALGCAAHESGDINEGHGGGSDALRREEFRQCLEPVIRHRHHALVGFYGAKGIVRGVD